MSYAMWTVGLECNLMDYICDMYNEDYFNEKSFTNTTLSRMLELEP